MTVIQPTAKKKLLTHEPLIYRSFKIPLKKLIKDASIHPLIHKLVFDMHDLVVHTYQFIRLYVLSVFKAKKDLPLIDSDFVLSCMRILGIRDKRGISPKETNLTIQLKKFYDQEYQPLLKHQKISLIHKTKVINYLSQAIAATYSTNIQEHFVQHFTRFLKKTVDTEKYTQRSFIHACLSLKETDLKFDAWKQTHLQHIFPLDIKKSVHYDLVSRPLAYLPGLLYMNTILEEKVCKLFQPLPLRSSIVPKHILLDTACLVDLFCPPTNYLGAKANKLDMFKHITDNKQHVWQHVLNLGHPIFKHKGYQFDYQMQTDGFSCNLLFVRQDLANRTYAQKHQRKPKLSVEEFTNLESLTTEQMNNFDGYNIVGCDPGKHDLIYLVDENGNKVHFTASQRHIESYAKRNKRILLQEKRKHGIEQKETQLSKWNSKSLDLEKFKAYLVEKDRLNKETSEFYQREVWRKMQFRQFAYGNKSIDKLLNRIRETFGEKILIGYGNWSRNSQMKGCQPTLNKGLRRRIDQVFDTVTVNEQCTSQKCHVCHELMEHAKDKDNKKIYRLFACKTCVSAKQNSVYRSRDENAAKNICHLTRYWLKEQKRPEAFKPKNAVSNTYPGLSLTIGVSSSEKNISTPIDFG